MTIQTFAARLLIRILGTSDDLFMIVNNKAMVTLADYGEVCEQMRDLRKLLADVRNENKKLKNGLI